MAQRASAALEVADVSDAPVPPAEPNGHHQLRSLPANARALLLTDSISPLPLHKTLALFEVIERDRDPSYERHERLALAGALVTSISNLEFGPEVGVGPAKADAPETSDDEGGEEKPKKKAATKADGDKPKKAAKPAKAPVARADSKSKGGAKKGSTPRKAGSS